MSEFRLRQWSTRVLLGVFLAVFTAAQAIAEGPRAVITGPSTAALGDLVILDASQSTGQAYHWVLVNSDQTFLPIEEGRRMVFASGQAREFIFLLLVGGYNSKRELAVHMAEHRVTIGGVPPAPPPGPTSFQVFPREIPGWAAEIKSSSRRQQAQELATVFTEYADKAAQFESLTDLTRATSDDYKFRLGLDAYLAWRPFLERVEGELRQLMESGSLSDPLSYPAAWRAIAEGLEGVQ